MKLTPTYLKEMVKDELRECGMTPPSLPDQDPVSPCDIAASGGPPEGSYEATFASEVADLVADIVYNVLMSKIDPEANGHDCATEHPDESHELWDIKNMFKKSGINLA